MGFGARRGWGTVHPALSPTGRCSDPEEGLERRYAGCFENLINNDFLKLYKR